MMNIDWIAAFIKNARVYHSRYHFYPWEKCDCADCKLARQLEYMRKKPKRNTQRKDLIIRR